MRTIKRLLAAGLAVAMLGSVPAFAAGTDGLEHFQPVAAYSDGLFTDLDAGGWYMENVKTAYELGLMKGIGSGSFSPVNTAMQMAQNGGYRPSLRKAISWS